MRFGEVRGYLARPERHNATAAELWTANPLAEDIQLAARVRAVDRSLVLVVPATAQLSAARSYLEGQLTSSAPIATCPAGRCP